MPIPQSTKDLYEYKRSKTIYELNKLRELIHRGEIIISDRTAWIEKAEKSLSKHIGMPSQSPRLNAELAKLRDNLTKAKAERAAYIRANTKSRERLVEHENDVEFCDNQFKLKCHEYEEAEKNANKSNKMGLLDMIGAIVVYENLKPKR